jgi:RNA polymerase sigma-19 factor, ECF subfamily
VTDTPGREPLALTVARLRNGDHDAFEAVFREHYAGLCSFANRFVAAPDVAEEIVQDVFAGLWKGRVDLRITRSVRAWLYTSVRNHALNHSKRARAEQPLHADDARFRTQATPETDLLAGDVAHRVNRALESLPDRCRETMLLRWKHGLSHAEIAQSMGVTIKAVERNLSRGIRALRDRLGSTQD